MLDILILLICVICFILVNAYSSRAKLSSNDIHTDAADLALYRYNKHQYLHSPEWSTKRKAALKAAHYECEMCGATTALHVHHISYKDLYREKPEQLVCVCETCHTAIHLTYGYPKSIQDYENFYGPPIKLY